ncbi:hypothetical protein ACVDG8_037485 (plasmid) [Mesorhizobium sp. ORM8.1]
MLMPEKFSGNSVAHLPNGGIAVTVLFDPSNKTWLDRSVAGEPSGFVVRWSPATGWSEIAGSEIAGDNGLDASEDGKWLYIAGWSDGTVHRLSLEKIPFHRDRIKLGFLVDNIHLEPNGDLLAAGQVGSAKKLVEDCIFKSVAVCEFPTAVARIDLKSWTSKRIVEKLPSTRNFGSGTSALIAGGKIWIGSFTGDRVAILPEPK